MPAINIAFHVKRVLSKHHASLSDLAEVLGVNRRTLTQATITNNFSPALQHALVPFIPRLAAHMEPDARKRLKRVAQANAERARANRAAALKKLNAKQAAEAARRAWLKHLRDANPGAHLAAGQRSAVAERDQESTTVSKVLSEPYPCEGCEHATTCSLACQAFYIYTKTGDKMGRDRIPDGHWQGFLHARQPSAKFQALTYPDE